MSELLERRRVISPRFFPLGLALGVALAACVDRSTPGETSSLGSSGAASSSGSTGSGSTSTGSSSTSTGSTSTSSGSSSTTTGSTGSATSGSSGGGALWSSLQIPYGGGPIIAAPELITVEYQGDPNADDIAAFVSGWVGSSEFISQLSEYGITGGSFVGDYRLTSTAPTTATEDNAFAILDGALNAGLLPPPGPSSIYLLTLPPGSQIAGSDYAYHDYESSIGFNFALNAGASLPDYGTNLDVLTADLSHEIIEAATDPGPDFNGYFASWDVTGGEIADLCGWWTTTFNGYKVQRSWSNRAAALGQVACVPANDAEPFFEVGPGSASPLTIARGSSAQLTVTAVSADPSVTELKVWATASGVLTVSPTTTRTVAVGQTATFTVSVPSTATPGPKHVVGIEGWQTGTPDIYSLWDVQVVVE